MPCRHDIAMNHRTMGGRLQPISGGSSDHRILNVKKRQKALIFGGIEFVSTTECPNSVKQMVKQLETGDSTIEMDDLPIETSFYGISEP